MNLGRLICGTVALILTVQPPADEATKSDQRSLQGTWRVLAGNEGGKTFPPARVKGAKMVVTGNTIKIHEQDKQREMTFTLDAAKEPRTIDLTITGGKKGEMCRGIYTVEGDMLKICFARRGKARPSSFLPGQGSGEMLFVMKRSLP